MLILTMLKIICMLPDLKLIQMNTGMAQIHDGSNLDSFYIEMFSINRIFKKPYKSSYFELFLEVKVIQIWHKL